MNRIKDIFTKHRDYARMKDLTIVGIHPRTVACADGIIEKVKPGLSKLMDYHWDEHSSFTDIMPPIREPSFALTRQVYITGSRH